jgi:hypothetical protein
MALFNLLVDISANTSQLVQSVKQAEDQLTKFGEAAEHVKSALEIIGFAEVIHRVSDFTLEVIDLNDHLNDSKTKAGVAAEAFTQLAYAAKLNNVTTDSLSSAFVKMNVALSQASTGGKAQNEALTALGLTYKDLKALAPEDQFTIIADRINKLGTSADKSRAEVALFGKAGGDLASLFEKGADGILKMRQEAQNLGQSFTEEQLKVFEDAHKSIDRLNSSFSALATTIVGKYAPAITAFNSASVELLTGSKNLQAQIDLLENAKNGGGVTGFLINNLPGYSSAYEAKLNQLKQQQSLQSLVVDPNSLKLGGLLDGSSPGFQPDPNDILQPFHSTLGKEKIGGGTVNPVVQQYLDDTAALQEAGGKAYDEFSKTQAQLKGALDDGAISLDDFQERLANASLKYHDAIDIEPMIVSLKKLPEVLSEADRRSLDFVDDVSEAFDNAAHASGAFGQNLLKSLLQAFENRAIFTAIGRIGDALKDALNVGGRSGGSFIGDILGGFFGGGGSDIGSFADSAATSTLNDYSKNFTLGSAFGGGKAAGGPLQMGKWYVAGEKGPEPIWGGGPGAFASGYGGGGGGVTVDASTNVDARGASVELIKALPAILRRHADTVEARIVSGLQRRRYKLDSA